MATNKLRERQNGRTAPIASGSASSLSKAPSSSYDKTEPERDPQYGRMVFHLGSAAAMIYGFQSLSDLAAGHMVAPQVSHAERPRARAA